MKNYYEILEVNKKASKEIIEKAYKVLVKKYHPDLYDVSQKAYAEQKLKEINEAYKILSDDFLKSQYDKELYKQQEDIARNRYNAQTEEVKKHRVNGSKNKRESKQNNNQNDYKIGTFASLIELVKQIISNRPKIEEKRQINQKDMLALGLTIVIMLILGIILWFIPFTNSWIRDMLFFLN